MSFLDKPIFSILGWYIPIKLELYSHEISVFQAATRGRLDMGMSQNRGRPLHVWRKT